MWNLGNRDSSGSNKSHKYLTRTKLAHHRAGAVGQRGTNISSDCKSDLWATGGTHVTSLSSQLCCLRNHSCEVHICLFSTFVWRRLLIYLAHLCQCLFSLLFQNKEVLGSHIMINYKDFAGNIANHPEVWYLCEILSDNNTGARIHSVTVTVT